MNSKINVSPQGVSLGGLLGVVFVTLKLCGVINWSWWLVTLPFWAGLAMAAAVYVGVFVVAGLGWLAFLILAQIEKWRNR
jgi:hypothetical protein